MSLYSSCFSLLGYKIVSGIAFVEACVANSRSMKSPSGAFHEITANWTKLSIHFTYFQNEQRGHGGVCRQGAHSHVVPCLLGSALASNAKAGSQVGERSEHVIVPKHLLSIDFSQSVPDPSIRPIINPNQKPPVQIKAQFAKPLSKSSAEISLCTLPSLPPTCVGKYPNKKCPVTEKYPMIKNILLRKISGKNGERKIFISWKSTQNKYFISCWDIFCHGTFFERIFSDQSLPPFSPEKDKSSRLPLCFFVSATFSSKQLNGIVFPNPELVHQSLAKCLSELTVCSARSLLELNLRAFHREASSKETKWERNLSHSNSDSFLLPPPCRCRA